MDESFNPLHIPELIDIILSKLPRRDLVRCRKVNKLLCVWAKEILRKRDLKHRELKKIQFYKEHPKKIILHESRAAKWKKRIHTVTINELESIIWKNNGVHIMELDNQGKPYIRLHCPKNSRCKGNGSYLLPDIIERLDKYPVIKDKVVRFQESKIRSNLSRINTLWPNTPLSEAIILLQKKDKKWRHERAKLKRRKRI